MNFNFEVLIVVWEGRTSGRVGRRDSALVGCGLEDEKSIGILAFRLMVVNGGNRRWVSGFSAIEDQIRVPWKKMVAALGFDGGARW